AGFGSQRRALARAGSGGAVASAAGRFDPQSIADRDLEHRVARHFSAVVEVSAGCAGLAAREAKRSRLASFAEQRHRERCQELVFAAGSVAARVLTPTSGSV